MEFTTWRGSVGVIKPTLRLGATEEFLRLLPDGIGVLPIYLNVDRGTTEQFKSVLPSYEEAVGQLVEAGVDLVHPEGAPPFMVQGFAGEQEIVRDWEDKYHVPIVTSSMSALSACKTLGMTKIIGVSYFRGEINDLFARYFEEAGIEVAVMAGMDVAFDRAQWLSSREVYAFTRKLFLEHPGVDGIYLLGSGWRVLDIIDLLEQDLEVPVVHPIPSRIWTIQHHLHVREKIAGYGQLLRELPKPLSPSA
jgi:maleate cis-trans isomerase